MMFDMGMRICSIELSFLSSHQASYPSSPGPQGYPSPQNQSSPSPLIDSQPQKQATRGWIKVVGVVVALLLVLGTAGFFARNFVGQGVTNNGGKRTPTNETPVTTSGMKTTPTSSSFANGSATTTPINATVTYADDTMTIIDAKQAQHFTDENASGNILRLDLKEQTDLKPPYFGTYGYSGGVHVILPDGNSVQPINVQHNDLPASSISRTNWFDFQVAVTTPLNQITLRLGTPTEYTIDIPLKENVNVGQYQPMTVTPNKLLHPMSHRAQSYSLTILGKPFGLEHSITQMRLFYRTGEDGNWIRGKLTVLLFPMVGLASFGDVRDAHLIVLVLVAVRLAIVATICNAMEMEVPIRFPWPSLNSMAIKGMISTMSVTLLEAIS